MSRWPVAEPSEYWLLAGSLASKVKKKQSPHSTTYTHKITTHTRQLQQYTRSTNNIYPKDNLKLATKHTRQIRILQQVQKVKHSNKWVLCTVPCNFFLKSLIFLQSSLISSVSAKVYIFVVINVKKSHWPCCKNGGHKQSLLVTKYRTKLELSEGAHKFT